MFALLTVTLRPGKFVEGGRSKCYNQSGTGVRRWLASPFLSMVVVFAHGIQQFRMEAPRRLRPSLWDCEMKWLVLVMFALLTVILRPGKFVEGGRSKCYNQSGTGARRWLASPLLSLVVVFAHDIQQFRIKVPRRLRPNPWDCEL
ncbi:hypothetical protein PEDI_12950 [Persicobacter diffluens]|uniref:Uncharacterized protein n=1 Tax=Persicobacter diffluens TaxID=981 RepID=A0AAN4VW16_9BACT|nr:hypothetical protein PEDI_12950 [Persicobacter diffluens]